VDREREMIDGARDQAGRNTEFGGGEVNVKLDGYESAQTGQELPEPFHTPRGADPHRNDSAR